MTHPEKTIYIDWDGRQKSCTPHNKLFDRNPVSEISHNKLFDKNLLSEIFVKFWRHTYFVHFLYTHVRLPSTELWQNILSSDISPRTKTCLWNESGRRNPLRMHDNGESVASKIEDNTRASAENVSSSHQNNGAPSSMEQTSCQTSSRHSHHPILKFHRSCSKLK